MSINNLVVMYCERSSHVRWTIIWAWNANYL